MRLIRLATPGLATAITIFVIAHAATTIGYRAAQSPGPPDVNLTQTIENASADLEENASAGGPNPTVAVGQGIFKLASYIAQPSVEFGYRNPEAAWWYLRTSPVVVGGSLLVYGYGWWREIRRGGPP